MVWCRVGWVWHGEAAKEAMLVDFGDAVVTKLEQTEERVE
jgi:hypothetical protein